MISVAVASESTTGPPVEGQVKSLIELVFTREGIVSAEVNLIFTDDDYLSELKQQFFRVGQLTDVIAFRLNDYSAPEPEGEIYISLPRARENAAEFGESFAREAARLIIHGSLHLLGYDDSTADEKQQMTAREETYLVQFDWTKLYDE